MELGSLNTVTNRESWHLIHGACSFIGKKDIEQITPQIIIEIHLYKSSEKYLITRDTKWHEETGRTPQGNGIRH